MVLFVTSNQQINTSRTSGPTVTTPAAAAGTTGIGDVLVFVAAAGTTGNFNTVTGFTAINPGAEIPSNSFRAYYRVCTGSEASSYSAAIGGGGTTPYSNVGWMGRWRDLDTSPLRESGVTPSSGVDTSTSPTPPALVGTLGDDLVINVYVSGTSNTGLTQTTTNLTNNGWTVRANINNSSTADDRCAVTVGEKTCATDRPTITSSVACDWATLSLSLKNLPFTPALLQARAVMGPLLAQQLMAANP